MSVRFIPGVTIQEKNNCFLSFDGIHLGYCIILFTSVYLKAYLQFCGGLQPWGKKHTEWGRDGRNS